MAATQSAALKQWARVIQKWPIDKVRPENVSFQRVMQSRLDKLTSPNPTASNTKANNASVTPTEPPVLDQQRELRQIKALDALLEDRFAKAYPIPNAVRYPRSSPTHYDDVAKEMDAAPTRSWFESLVKRVKGSLRFS